MLALVLLLACATVALAVAFLRLSRHHQTFRSRMQAALGAATESETSLTSAATSLTNRTRTAHATAERFRGALELTQVAVVIYDENGTEVFASDSADSSMSRSAGDGVIGIRLRELVREATDSGKIATQEIEVFTPLPRILQLRALPLSFNGQSRGVIAFAEDLTPRSHLDTIRRDFMANASHELKTPLGALRLLADALVATQDPTTRESLGERIQSEALRMTRLVEDILDLSLVEQQPTGRGVVDICDVIEDSIAQAALASETLNIPIRVECEPVAVLGDRRGLVSAVANLIENALVYTSAKGSGPSAAVVVRGFRDGETAQIEVEDHGIGIAARHQARIFERFYRVDRGRSRASGGTGLGLAIASHVVKNHGGEIEVESEPGKGSTFRIRLAALEARED